MTHRIVTLNSLADTNRIESDPWTADCAGQKLMCRIWAHSRGLEVHEQLVMADQPSGVRALWERDDPRPLLFVTPSRRILELVMADPEDFAAVCRSRGARLEYADLPEPEYTRGMRDVLYRRLALPTEGSPTLWRGDLYTAQS